MKTINLVIIFFFLPLECFAKAAAILPALHASAMVRQFSSDCEEADEAALRQIILEDQIKTARLSDSKTVVAKQNFSEK